MGRSPLRVAPAASALLGRDSTNELANALAAPSFRGKAPVLTSDGDTLDTLPQHVVSVVGLWVASLAALAPTAQALHAAGAGAGALSAVSGEALRLALLAVGTVAFSDAFSGLFHWATDNYGNKRTPVFGGVIDAFQGHHGNPWTITHRSFFNNVHKIARAALPLLALACLASAAPGWRLFAVLFLNAQVLSQEFHKLAHEPRPPAWAQALQGANLAISKKVHGAHHTTPFEAHYCILTGWCNPPLDRALVWRRAEAFVYRANGQEPNCWKDDPSLKALSLKL